VLGRVAPFEGGFDLLEVLGDRCASHAAIISPARDGKANKTGKNEGGVALNPAPADQQLPQRISIGVHHPASAVEMVGVDLDRHEHGAVDILVGERLEFWHPFVGPVSYTHLT